MIKSTGVITVSSFSSMFVLGISITVIGAAARNIGLEPSQIGYLIAAQNLGFMFSVAIVGALSDRYHKPQLLFFGSVILSVALVVFYSSETFWVNLVIMGAVGVGIGAYEGATDTMLLDVHHRHENLIINFNHFFVSAGSVAVTGYLLYLQMGWRRAVVQTGIAVGVLALIYLLMRIEHERRTGNSLADAWRFLRRQRIVGSLFFAEICSVGLGVGSTGILTTFLMELRAFDQVTSKIGLMIFLSGLALGRIVSGVFARRGSIFRLVPVSFAAAAVLFSVLYFVPLPPVPVYFLVAACGLVISPLLPMQISLAGLIFRDMAGTAMGVVKVAIPVGGIVIPFVVSVLADAVSFGASLVVFPLIAVAGLASYLVSARAIRDGLPESA